MTIRFMRSPWFNARACLVLLIALPLSAQLADGDRHWNARANGAAEVDSAIAAYQRAVTQTPNDVVAHARLLRAIRFKGAYIAKSADDKKKVYGVAKAAGEKALAVLAARGITSKLNEKQAAEAARAIPGAAEVFLWDSINWGEWALAYGKMAAAREGAADRIKRGATIAMLADPRLEGGAAYRVLGRLHDQTPRIPFITGWASSKEAVRFLNEAMKIDSASKITIVFLAEAMVSNDSKTKAQAIQMLKKAVAAPNNPEFVIEEQAAVEDAKALLRKWGA
jgi:tetratricopeptide (TPR) repeat protein